MVIGVLLNHLEVFGGVKRFLEIGTHLVKRGHRVLIFTHKGEPPLWFPFTGEVYKLGSAEQDSLEVIIASEPAFIPTLKSSKALVKVFYAILQRRKIKAVLAEKDITVWANSLGMYKYLNGAHNPQVFPMIGGIDLERFPYLPIRNPEVITILAYGRFYRKKKGVGLVIRACEYLYNQGFPIRLMLFDTPVDDAGRKAIAGFTCKVPFEFILDYPIMKMADVYHKADLFVSAERNAGWANTVIEAMACGVPVVTTRSGTRDFVKKNETGVVVWRHWWFIQRGIRKLLSNPALRSTFSKAGRECIEPFDWAKLSERIEAHLLEKLR